MATVPWNVVPDYAHQPFSDDPESVPVSHAATVLVGADRPDFEVLMVQRASGAVFGPSAWVFPGGRVDPEDAADHEHITTGLSDEEASALLGLRHGGRAWWIAGIRETLEEAGLLLAAGSPPDHVVDRVRRSVHADPASFVEAMAAADLVADLRQIHEVARFITPVGPPRRFDARFFIARAPLDQIAQPDAGEVVRHCWIEPSTAMSQFDAGRFPLMSVTHRMLESVARYSSADAVLEAAAARPIAQPIRVADPDDSYRVLLPGDPGYEHADDGVEEGWVRL